MDQHHLRVTEKGQQMSGVQIDCHSNVSDRVRLQNSFSVFKLSCDKEIHLNLR